VSELREPPRERSTLERQVLRILSTTEHLVFFIIGVLLFVVALVLLAHAAMSVVPMLGPNAHVVQNGTRFLDQILLVLMIVELAYTVMLSLRGAVLSAEPFLIVALIAVIRRILVITVGEPRTAGNMERAASSATLLELGVLTAVVLAFVSSILLLRLRHRSRSDDRALAAVGDD
jgi:uncharacterized membrane protein (DUF373 family)